MRTRLAAAATAGFLVLAPASALADDGSVATAAVVASNAENGNDDGGNEGLWGLLGLLGLAGLAGLKRRNDHDTTTRNDDRPTNPR